MRGFIIDSERKTLIRLLLNRRFAITIDLVVDGVLYHESRLLGGALPFIHWLKVRDVNAAIRCKLKT